MLRLRSGGLTSKNGFSVVAPIIVKRAVLDRRQQTVLLRLVEAVDLVEEQDRAAAVLAQALTGPFDHLAHILDAGVDGAHLLEHPLRAAGDGERQGGLAGAGRPPEDGAGQPVLLDQPAQRLARADQVVLADDIVERARPQPSRQRRLGCAGAARRQR